MVEIRMHYLAAADVQNSKVTDFLDTFMALGGSILGPLVPIFFMCMFYDNCRMS